MSHRHDEYYNFENDPDAIRAEPHRNAQYIQPGPRYSPASAQHHHQQQQQQQQQGPYEPQHQQFEPPHAQPYAQTVPQQQAQYATTHHQFEPQAAEHHQAGAAHGQYRVQSSPTLPADETDHRKNLRRMGTNEVEVGVSDVLQTHVTRHIAHVKPVSQRRLNFEHKRPRVVREIIAETLGTFIYVYPGLASTASLYFTGNNAAYGSVFQIGMAYALGVTFAIYACATTSGGHFSPAITLNFAVWQNFPWWKVPYYIVAQVFGAFLAALVIYGQYNEQFTLFRTALEATDGTLVGFANTPAAVLAPMPQPWQTSQGYLFFIELFASSFLGLVIWAVLDPANPFVTPASAPFAIGLAYAVMYWGFYEATVSLNTAKDLGTRIVAAIFFGGDAFPSFSWIPILVNILGFFVATTTYEMFLRDSLDRIGMGHADHEDGEHGLRRHLASAGLMELHEPGAANVLRRNKEL